MMYFIPSVLLHPIRRSQRSVADIYLPDEDRGVMSSLILPLAPAALAVLRRQLHNGGSTIAARRTNLPLVARSRAPTSSASCLAAKASARISR